MTKFLNRLREKKHMREMTARERYLSLLKKAGTAGDLETKDADALDAAARELGIPFERIEADAAYLADFHAQQSAASELSARREAFGTANAAHAASEAETRRIIDQRKTLDDQLYRDAMTARQSFQAAEAAVKKVREMQISRPELVGERPKAPAFLLLADPTSPLATHLVSEAAPMVAKFITSASARAIDAMFAAKIQPLEAATGGRGESLSSIPPRIADGLMAQKLNELESLRTESKAAVKAAQDREAKTAKAAHRIIRIDPSDKGMESVNIDPGDFDFRPAPGQEPAEFETLRNALLKHHADLESFRRMSTSEAWEVSQNRQRGAVVAG